MADTNGIRSVNLPLDDSNPAVEVLVHAQIGGHTTIRRQSLGIFIARILALATEGGGPDAPTVLATLLARGFTLDANGNLHLTQVEAGLAAEIIRAKAAEIPGARADGLRRQKSAAYRYINGTPRLGYVGGTYGPGDCMSWAVGTAVSKEEPNPLAWEFWISPAGLFDIYIRVHSRPGAVGNGGAALVWPGEHPDDKELFLGGTRITELTATPDNGNYTPMLLPIDPGPMQPGLIYFATLFARDKTGAPAPIGLSRGRTRINDGIDPLWKSGVFRVTNGSIIAPTDNGMVAHALMGARYTDGIGADVDNSGTLRADGEVDRIYTVPSSNTSWTINLPQSEIANYPEPIPVSSFGDVAGVDRVQIQDVGNEGLTLAYNTDAKLNHEYVDVFQVRAGGIVLTKGVDYSFDTRQGTIRGLQNVAARSVTVDYNWGGLRYDDIVANPVDGGKIVSRGQERARDPNEYLPDHPGFPTIVRVLVTRFEAEIIRVDQFSGFCRKGREAAYAEHLARNRRCLPKTFALLNAGEAIRLGGYGDSITAVGAGTPFYEANGAGRDLLNYLAEENVAADTVSKVQTYDGPAGAGKHIRIGWNWLLKANIEKRYGALVEYRNWGIPGTSIGPGLQSFGSPNALYPDRLNAYTADRCDLTVFAFGMNDLGAVNSDDVYSWAVTGIRAIQDAGGEVIVMTPPRPSGLAQWVIDQWWLEITKKLVRAAITTDSAYVDLSQIMGPSNEGGIGLSSKTMSELNRYNHPMIYEFAREGAFLSETFVR